MGFEPAHLNIALPSGNTVEVDITIVDGCVAVRTVFATQSSDADREATEHAVRAFIAHKYPTMRVADGGTELSPNPQVRREQIVAQRGHWN